MFFIDHSSPWRRRDPNHCKSVAFVLIKSTFRAESRSHSPAGFILGTKYTAENKVCQTTWNNLESTHLKISTKEARVKLLVCDIVSKNRKNKIPHSFVLNLDQTPSKYVPTSDETMAPKGSKTVPILTGNRMLWSAINDKLHES